MVTCRRFREKVELDGEFKGKREHRPFLGLRSGAEVARMAHNHEVTAFDSRLRYFQKRFKTFVVF